MGSGRARRSQAGKERVRVSFTDAIQGAGAGFVIGFAFAVLPWGLASFASMVRKGIGAGETKHVEL